MGKDVDRERAIGRLVRRVQTIVEESGNPEGFNVAEWVARWIDRPLPALGGKAPNEFIGTEEGLVLIEQPTKVGLSTSIVDNGVGVMTSEDFLDGMRKRAQAAQLRIRAAVAARNKQSTR